MPVEIFDDNKAAVTRGPPPTGRRGSAPRARGAAARHPPSSGRNGPAVGPAPTAAGRPGRTPRRGRGVQSTGAGPARPRRWRPARRGVGTRAATRRRCRAGAAADSRRPGDSGREGPAAATTTSCQTLLAACPEPFRGGSRHAAAVWRSSWWVQPEKAPVWIDQMDRGLVHSAGVPYGQLVVSQRVRP